MSHKVWDYTVVHPDAIISDGVVIGSHCYIGGKVMIGENTRIQSHVFIPDGVTIGRDCFIAPSVIFTNDRKPPSHGKGWQKITVGDEASIGAGAILIAGVVIGNGAKIAAGAVVTKHIPRGELWGGVPAHNMASKGFCPHCGNRIK